MSGREMATKLKLGKSLVNRWIKDNGLAVPRSLVVKFQSDARKGTTSSTPSIDTYLRANYKKLPQKRIAETIGRSHTFVVTRLKQLGLVIPREIIEQFRKESQIKPGNVPLNKGKKMSKEMYNKCAPTMFKKGQLPHTTLYDGCITVRHDHPDRKGHRYKWIRISKAKWEMLHVHNWKKKHGPIPKGFIVAFKTADTMNCSPGNLMLITRAENMKRNTIHRYPMELKQTMRMIGRLSRKIKQHGKK